MIRVYNVPNGYSYHAHTYPMTVTGTEGSTGHLVNTLLSGIQKKASSVDFYHRLAKIAPNNEERQFIMRMMEDEQRHWWELTNVYTSLTDSHPVYHVESIPFHSYREGLKRAYKAELADYEQFRVCSMQAQHSVVYEVLVNTCRDEWEHARTLCELGSAEEIRMMSKDVGPAPYAVNIDEATVANDTFRTALWTGEHLQVTLMSINPGEDIGLEIHPNLDQFLRLEQGEGIVRMGDRQDHLTYEKQVQQDFAIMIPAGTWHNLINTGNTKIKLYSIYAPPQHPKGTVHVTKADAMAAEGEH
ncbi:cupin domain-containing protein [Rossellomorea aquimaris]|uniref:cupin domain-containing protein n=1 Tax=Rossellomorea aquimaris TaxID=189382 RepID=UPI001CD77A36|nr:cupin domain-containing protein [Rossellomorea aquimaris]MCA1058903.1 cupin domain-containing protein [Rossellomorea aquimaris]